MTAKTNTQRADDLRERRELLGLKRREVYAHDDDWPALRERAAKMVDKRETTARKLRKGESK
jgi:hypothetical protein